MAYVQPNFKSKKALKEALKKGTLVEVYQPGLGNVPENGFIHLEGPHHPEPHNWYGEGTMVNGCLTSVR